MGLPTWPKFWATKAKPSGRHHKSPPTRVRRPRTEHVGRLADSMIETAGPSLEGSVDRSCCKTAAD
jgi:hypothetical protein